MPPPSLTTCRSKQLRDYQERAVTMLRQAHRERPLLVLPTGAGKTVVACHIISRFQGPALFVVHRRELALQAQRRLADNGIEAGLILGGERPVDARVQIASVQTLLRREAPAAGLVFVDEAHHAAAKSWGTALAPYDEAIVIGMTATPFRLDRKGLGAIFRKLVVPVTMRELIANGVLIEPKVYCTPPPDLTGVRKVAGDYHEGQLGERMSTLVGDVVAHWRKHPRKAVAFAVNIKHSHALLAAFQSQGVAAAHIDGDTPRVERDAAIRALEAGDIQVLCNCALLGEGWDLPALEVAILARPTCSLTVHMQQIGRVMRACPGKDGAVVLDHAGNHHTHGLVTDEIDYELTTEHAKATERPDFKTCRVCWVICPLSATECPECGAPFVTEPTVPRHEDGELEEFRPLSFEERRKVYRDLVELASLRGYKLGWAKVQYKDRFHVWPRKMADVETIYRCRGHEWEVRTYGVVCGRCLRRKP